MSKNLEQKIGLRACFAILMEKNNAFILKQSIEQTQNAKTKNILEQI